VTVEGRRETSAEELALATEELEAAELLVASGRPRIALTRAYFAVFHALRGLLYAHGHEPRSHAGVHHLFNRHFVKTGRYEPATSRVVARLQKYREEADYAHAFVVDETGAREELEAAGELVRRVAAELGDVEA